MLVAIDHMTKFAFVELHKKAMRKVADDFLRHFIEAVPYKVLTDDGAHFSTPDNVASAAPIIKAAIAGVKKLGAYNFEAACARNDILVRPHAHQVIFPQFRRHGDELAFRWACSGVM